MSEEARQELRALSQAVRAWTEWHQITGSTGLPVNLAPSPVAHEARSAPARPRANERSLPRSEIQHEAAPAESVASRLKAEPPVLGPERERRLTVLAAEVASCEKCELSGSRSQTVFARGNPHAELCFVGEGPGAEEDAQGLPFVGRAGELLDRMIAGMGLGKDDVYICNIVKCRPPQNRTPSPDELAACTPYLTQQLELVRPKVIVALGGTALRGLLGPGEGITKARGAWKLYRRTIPVMPTFHPSYLLRAEGNEERSLKRQVWTDLQLVLKQLGRPVPKPRGK